MNLLKNLGFLLNSKKCIADNRVLGVHHQLDRDDLVSSRVQSMQDKERMPSCSQSTLLDGETISPSNRATVCMHSGRFGSSAALQSPTAIKASGCRSEREQLRSLHSDFTQSTTGYLVVDPQSLHQPLSSNPETISFHHTGDRCFYSRLGSLLSRDRHEDRRIMVSQRPEKPHQLAGASRSFPGSSEFCSKETESMFF